MDFKVLVASPFVHVAVQLLEVLVEVRPLSTWLGLCGDFLWVLRPLYMISTKGGIYLFGLLVRRIALANLPLASTQKGRSFFSPDFCWPKVQHVNCRESANRKTLEDISYPPSDCDEYNEKAQGSHSEGIRKCWGGVRSVSNHKKRWQTAHS
jgi:hypothetical protein